MMMVLVMMTGQNDGGAYDYDWTQFTSFFLTELSAGHFAQTDAVCLTRCRATDQSGQQKKHVENVTELYYTVFPNWEHPLYFLLYFAVGGPVPGTDGKHSVRLMTGTIETTSLETV